MNFQTMSMKNKKLVIFGTGETADIAYEYFTHDSEYDVVAFTVEASFKNEDKLYELPVISFEEVEQKYPPNEVEMFVAISYTKLNRVRATASLLQGLYNFFITCVD